MANLLLIVSITVPLAIAFTGIIWWIWWVQRHSEEDDDDCSQSLCSSSVGVPTYTMPPRQLPYIPTLPTICEEGSPMLQSPLLHPTSRLSDGSRDRARKGNVSSPTYRVPPREMPFIPTLPTILEEPSASSLPSLSGDKRDQASKEEPYYSVMSAVM